MSRRDWLRNGALVGVAAALLLGVPVVLYQQYQASQRQDAATYDIRRASEQSYDPCGRMDGIIDRINCVSREIHAQADAKISEYDLQAQQNMAAWAFGLLIVSYLGLIVTTGGVIYVGLTFRETQRMVREAQKTTDAAIRGADAALSATAEAKETNRIAERNAAVEHRPWVIPKIDVLGFEINKTKMRANVRFRIRNAGLLPALNLRTACILTTYGGDIVPVEKDFYPPKGGVLAPNDEMLLVRTLADSDIYTKSINGESREITPLVAITIEYTGSDYAVKFRTRKAFGITKIDTKPIPLEDEEWEEDELAFWEDLGAAIAT